LKQITDAPLQGKAKISATELAPLSTLAYYT